MTRKAPATPDTPQPTPAGTLGRWRLQEAKARFSELVRRVQSEGPQHVTLHGRDAVVVIGAEEFRRLTGQRPGQLLVEALQASPHRDIDLTPPRVARLRRRDVQVATARG